VFKNNYQNSDELPFSLGGETYIMVQQRKHNLQPFEGFLFPLTSHAHSQNSEIHRKSPQLMENPWFPIAFPLNNPKDKSMWDYSIASLDHIPIRTSPHMSQAHM
jgi:hypothetical protein